MNNDFSNEELNQNEENNSKNYNGDEEEIG
jgi:hypothetical protein